MKNQILAMSWVMVLGLTGMSSAKSECRFARNAEGALVLAAGAEHALEIEIPQGSQELQVVKQVCDSTYRAIRCTRYTLAQDEYIHGEHDGFGVTPTVNLGRERARLTIGQLEPWIAQFAAENYEDDQGGVYTSVEACEYHRARISIEVSERSHEIFVEQHRANERAKNYPTNFHGLKH